MRQILSKIGRVTMNILMIAIGTESLYQLGFMGILNCICLLFVCIYFFSDDEQGQTGTEMTEIISGIIEDVKQKQDINEVHLAAGERP